MTKTDFLLRQLDSTLGWYRQSEEKAKFLVAINTTVASVASGLVFVATDRAGSRFDGVAALLLLLLGLALLLSFGFILHAVWARHTARDDALPDTARLWFFGDVARLPPDRHRQALESLTEEALPGQLEAMLASQSRILSAHVWRKHQALNLAIVFTVLSVGLLFALGIAHAGLITAAPRP